MQLLVDGDMLVFRLCAAVQENSPFDRTLVLDACPEKTWKCIQMRLEECEEIVADYFNEDVNTILTFTSPRNFRKEINPEYKANRKNLSKPVLYSDMVDKCKRNYHCEEWDGLEADDVMGILQNTKDTIIITGDKDLRQCPGYHLNLIDPESGIEKISKRDGDFLFLCQCLSGDPVDNFKGVPGIGKKKSDKIITEALKRPLKPLWDVIQGKYREKGLSPSDALLNARMAYILQKDSDYDKETGEVRLWTPM